MEQILNNHHNNGEQAVTFWEERNDKNRYFWKLIQWGVVDNWKGKSLGTKKLNVSALAQDSG